MTADEIAVDRSEDGVAIVSVVGEHDMNSAPQLQYELDGAVRDRLSVVVDLTRTMFVDSQIVAILLRAWEEAHVSGVRFALVMDDSTGPSVRRLFAITGLDAMFAITHSRHEAVALTSG